MITSRIYAVARAEGKCEACGNPAPLMDSSGKPFLEVHHIRRLTDGGPDMDGVAAICPNCHREAHHGQRRAELNDHLLRTIKEKERLLSV
jgi:5-methylcytosine-specific restriction protein A